MIVLAAMLLAVLSPQQVQTDTEGRRLIRTYERPIDGTSRCLRNLPPARRVSIPITCRINSIGGPTQCTFEPGTTREQRYAAECVTRAYRFQWEDNTPAAGATVRLVANLVTH